MGVTGFDEIRRFPYADGISFGSTGPYEQIDGVLTFAVDPTSPVNSEIVDLHLASRDRNGLVNFKADLSVVRPVDPDRGSGTLIIELPNRG